MPGKPKNCFYQSLALGSALTALLQGFSDQFLEPVPSVLIIFELVKT